MNIKTQWTVKLYASKVIVIFNSYCVSFLSQMLRSGLVRVENPSGIPGEDPSRPSRRRKHTWPRSDTVNCKQNEVVSVITLCCETWCCNSVVIFMRDRSPQERQYVKSAAVVLSWFPKQMHWDSSRFEGGLNNNDFQHATDCSLGLYS